jgi:hypothetical protein
MCALLRLAGCCTHVPTRASVFFDWSTSSCLYMWCSGLACPGSSNFSMLFLVHGINSLRQLLHQNPQATGW